MSKKLEDLAPEMRSRAMLALSKMEAALKPMGLWVVVLETRRALTTQMAYYSRGRMAPDDVRAMYAAAGLYRPGDAEAKQSVTWTLKSKHLDGLAIDVAPSRDGLMPEWFSPSNPAWEALGKAGEEAGLKWGGRWKTQDCPHFEL